MLYNVKPEFLTAFGDEAYTDTILDDSTVEMIARGWEKSVEVVKDMLIECVPICTIDLSEGDGRQTIYWSLTNATLISDVDPATPCAAFVETRRDANMYAGILWGFTDWNLEWIK